MSTPSCGWRLEARGVTSVVFQIPPSFIVHIPGRGRRFVSVTWPHYLHIYTYLHISTQAQLGDSYPCLVLPALHIIIETLNLHVISAAWDVQVSSLQI